MQGNSSQISRIAFLSYLIDISLTQLTNITNIFPDPFTDRYTSLIYDTLFSPLSDALFEYLRGVYTELHTSRACAFRQSAFDFLKRLESTLNNAAIQPRKEIVHKITRREIKGFSHFLKYC